MKKKRNASTTPRPPPDDTHTPQLYVEGKKKRIWSGELVYGASARERGYEFFFWALVFRAF